MGLSSRPAVDPLDEHVVGKPLVHNDKDLPFQIGLGQELEFDLFLGAGVGGGVLDVMAVGAMAGDEIARQPVLEQKALLPGNINFYLYLGSAPEAILPRGRERAMARRLRVPPSVGLLQCARPRQLPLSRHRVLEEPCRNLEEGPVLGVHEEVPRLPPC